MTLHLQFEASLELQNLEACIRIADSLPSCNDFKQEMAFACVQDAEKAGQHELAIRLLLKLTRAVGPSANAGIPELELRKLIIRQILQLGHNTSLFVPWTELNEQFDAVAVIARDPQLAQKHKCTIDELDWYSKHGYNIAVDNLEHWPLHEVFRLLMSSIAVSLHNKTPIVAT